MIARRTHHVGLDTLPIGCTSLVDVLANTVPSHEGDSLDVRAVTHGIHCLLLPMDDVEDTFRKSSLVGQLDQEHAGTRVLLTGLHDVGVTTDQP